MGETVADLVTFANRPVGRPLDAAGVPVRLFIRRWEDRTSRFSHVFDSGQRVATAPRDSLFRMPHFRGGPTTRLLLLLLAVVSLAGLFTTRVERKMPDFAVYRTAGTRAIAREPLYRSDDGHYQFKYLPGFALLVSPIALMPERAAKALWFSAAAVLMLVLLALSLAALPAPRLPPALLLALTFVAMAKFYAHEMVLGQVNLLFAVLATLALVRLRHRGEVAGGLLFALTVAVKPYAIIFMPWLVTRRRHVALTAMVGGVIVLLLAPAIWFGWHANAQLLADWWQTARTTTAPNVLNSDNVSLAALFTRWTGSESLAGPLAAITGAVLLVVCGVVIVARRALPSDAPPDALEASLLLLIIPLLSPQGWDYVLLIGTPAVMLLINGWPALPRGLRIASAAALIIVAFSIYDFMGREAYAVFMNLSLITACVIVEFAALVALRFRRAA